MKLYLLSSFKSVLEMFWDRFLDFTRIFISSLSLLSSYSLCLKLSEVTAQWLKLRFQFSRSVAPVLQLFYLSQFGITECDIYLPLSNEGKYPKKICIPVSYSKCMTPSNPYFVSVFVMCYNNFHSERRLLSISSPYKSIISQTK